MVPTYDKLYMPLLRLLSNRDTYAKKDIVAQVADQISLSTEDRSARMPNGVLTFPYRIAWTCTYLKKAGLIESPARGQFKITEEGFRALHSNATIDNAFLTRYPSFLEFKGATTQGHSESTMHQNISVDVSSETPEDTIAHAISTINQKLADELMSEIMAQDPAFFERLVVKLLCQMGYGGSASDSGIVTQKSNDGGIDGIIREDKLGFDQIYIQAKRWDTQTTISRPEIQKFYGALAGFGASKGLFITTAKFSSGAKEYANQQHIVLVDGDRLTKLMIEYNLGVSPIAKYEIKALDTDFFNED